MGILDELRRARTDRPSVWMQYITTYRPGCPDVYAFFEGKDDCAYYLPELRRRRGEHGVHHFICNGKKGVLEIAPIVLGSIDARARAAFFVDKDHDDFLGANGVPSDFFSTRWYSVENYLVDAEMLLAVWGQLLKLNAADERWSAVREAFEKEHRKFVRAIVVACAWVVAARRQGVRPHLNNVDVAKLVRVDPATLTCARARQRSANLARMCQVAAAPRWTEVRGVCREFKKLHPKVFVRGKWELWFFVTFVERIARALAEAEPEDRARLRVGLGCENAVDVLAPRHSYPRELHDYLDGRWGAEARTTTNFISSQ